MKSLSLVAAVAATAFVATFAGSASAQDLTLKMAHIYVPGNIWYDTAQAYADEVAKRSEGKIRIEIAHSGSTGDWPASIEGLLIGTNDIVLQSVGTLDRYGIIAGVEAYPYLIRDVEHFKKVYYGEVGAELYDAIAEQTQFRIVGAGYRGARQLTANRKVESLADLAGLKLRVPPLKMYELTWKYLGASPVPMGVAELFTSLQQHVVDGQENPLEVIESQHFDEVQDFVMETAHIMGAMTFIYSDMRFQQLPEATRLLLKEAGEEVMLAATDRMVASEAKYKADLEAKGMTFVAVDRAAFAAQVEPMKKDFPELAVWVDRIQAAH